VINIVYVRCSNYFKCMHMRRGSKGRVKGENKIGGVRRLGFQILVGILGCYSSVESRRRD
jgi:hypothetical protein